MFSFLLKKSLIDGWTHVLGLFLANIGYLFLLAVEGLIWYLNANGAVSFSLSMVLLIAVVPVISIYSFIVAFYVDSISDKVKKPVVFSDMITAIRKHIPHILCHSFVVMIVCINIVFAAPFYFELSGFFGPLMSFVSLFLSIFLIFGFKYYLSICMLRPDESALECIKYSFAYALDNKGLTFLLLLRSAVDIAVSIPLMGLVPGFCGIQLSDTCAAKILNTRYVLAEERNVTRDRIPMTDVLEQMDAGHYSGKSFKSLLFPRR